MSTAPQPSAPQPTPPPLRAAESPVIKSPPTSKPPVARQLDDPHAQLRRSVYALFIAASMGVMIGRVLAVNSVDQIGAENVLKNEGRENWQKQRPFLSSNDRSRWLTMRSLVERGTYAIDAYVTDPKTNPNWDTIDMVMHEIGPNEAHLYSSKPPLLATLYAGPYWLVYKISGAIRGTPITLGDHPFEIGRGLVLLFNVVPLVIYFFVLAKIVERYGKTDWGRIFVMAAATFGTFLTTFAVVINNHLPAAVSAVITLYAVLRIWYDGELRLRYFAIAGFFAAFTTSCELPALSFFAIITAALLWKFPKPTLVAFVPAALIVVVAFFVTNWLAHHSLIPAYAHREYGADNVPPPQYFDDEITLDSGQVIKLHGNPNNWYDYEFKRTDDKIAESYWRSGNRKGVDIGEPSIAKYAFHLLIGHHGIFSLTPIWLLAIPGVFILWLGERYQRRDLAILIALVSVVCVVFYVFRPLIERNYGGMTAGFRWVFWMAPLWLVAVLPVADRLAVNRLGRLLCGVLLVISALSASYPIWNPWTSPWLMNFWQYIGWPT